MKPKTRPGSSDDLPKVLELNEQSLPAVNSLTLQKLQIMVANSVFFQIVELNQQFAGFVLTFSPKADYDSENLRWFNERYQNFLYLDRIAVAGFAKQQGCGMALYSDVEEYCRKHTIANIALEVNTRPRNEGSLIFHEKMGFKEVGQQDTVGGSKTVSLMMKAVAL